MVTNYHAIPSAALVDRRRARSRRGRPRRLQPARRALCGPHRPRRRRAARRGDVRHPAHAAGRRLRAARRTRGRGGPARRDRRGAPDQLRRLRRGDLGGDDLPARHGGVVTAAPIAHPVPRGCDHLDDAELIARFESLAIAAVDFRHREHVRIAFGTLRGADFGDAAVRYRAALRRFAAAAGVPDRYHETLTWAYLAVISRRMAEDPS